jgi:hypothetical protein
MSHVALGAATAGGRREEAASTADERCHAGFRDIENAERGNNINGV